MKNNNAANEQHLADRGTKDTVPLLFGNGYRVTKWVGIEPGRYDEEIMRLWPSALDVWQDFYSDPQTDEQAVWWIEQSEDGIRNGIMPWSEAQTAIRSTLSVWGNGAEDAEDYIEDIRVALPKQPNDVLLVIHISGEACGHPWVFLSLLVRPDGQGVFVTGDFPVDSAGWNGTMFRLA